jgi:hypothetical protein
MDLRQSLRLPTAGPIEERVIAVRPNQRERAESLLACQDRAPPLAAANLTDPLRE